LRRQSRLAEEKCQHNTNDLPFARKAVAVLRVVIDNGPGRHALECVLPMPPRMFWKAPP